ncbi:hypothetical protein Pcinc_043316 [Petrolisthes cinctipes]|uniref:Uncharacterized protein n=1 Tax=Petrolisthes cinctipes TaxID=88211 RepID=A0AAE1BFU9_PETCI|nr:hypothetical protein Pcinc_043316 [Petrolisthes cinctipes]
MRIGAETGTGEGRRENPCECGGGEEGEKRKEKEYGMKKRNKMEKYAGRRSRMRRERRVSVRSECPEEYSRGGVRAAPSPPQTAKVNRYKKAMEAMKRGRQSFVSSIDYGANRIAWEILKKMGD